MTPPVSPTGKDQSPAPQWLVTHGEVELQSDVIAFAQVRFLYERVTRAESEKPELENQSPNFQARTPEPDVPANPVSC